MSLLLDSETTTSEFSISVAKFVIYSFTASCIFLIAVSIIVVDLLLYPSYIDAILSFFLI